MEIQEIIITSFFLKPLFDKQTAGIPAVDTLGHPGGITVTDFPGVRTRCPYAGIDASSELGFVN